MTLPVPSSTSTGPSLPRSRSGLRARRRRHGQLNVPPDASGRTALLATLSQRAYPTYELFVFAALCGAILSLGYFLDSQALLIFGALLAPLLLPWVGLLLATVTGSVRFFFETLMALLLSAVLVFMIGALAGLATRPFMPRTFNEAFIHSRLWWPDLLVLALGAAILTVSFVRSEAKPFLPNVILAYEFFLPLAAGGFGLGGGLSEVWPNGLLVFLVHFAWAGMFGLLSLVALRLMPTNVHGFVFSAAVAFVLLVLLVVLMSGGNWTPTFALHAASTPAPSAIANAAPIEPTSTPIIETPTEAPAAVVEVTLPPTASPTITLTFEPTPVYALVHASRGGAVLRETPGGKGLTVLDNFEYVQLLPETQDVSGYTWVHVIATHNGIQIEGWMAQDYLEQSTPAATLLPAATATATP